jgi:hypothetical protein
MLPTGRPIENRPQAASLPYISLQAAKIFKSSSTELVHLIPGRPINNRPQVANLPHISARGSGLEGLATQ